MFEIDWRLVSGIAACGVSLTAVGYVAQVVSGQYPSPLRRAKNGKRATSTPARSPSPSTVTPASSSSVATTTYEDHLDDDARPSIASLFDELLSTAEKLMGSGKTEEALSFYREIEEMLTTDKSDLSGQQRNGLSVSVLVRLCTKLAEHKRFDEAKKYAEKLERISNGEPSLELVKIFIDVEDFDRALTGCKNVVAELSRVREEQLPDADGLNMQRSKAYEYMAEAYVGCGPNYFEKAEQAYNKSITSLERVKSPDLTPRDLRMQIQMEQSKLLFAMKKTQEAEKLLDTVLETELSGIQISNSLLIRWVANNLLEAGRAEKAIDLYNRWFDKYFDNEQPPTKCLVLCRQATLCTMQENESGSKGKISLAKQHHPWSFVVGSSCHLRSNSAEIKYNLHKKPESAGAFESYYQLGLSLRKYNALPLGAVLVAEYEDLSGGDMQLSEETEITQEMLDTKTLELRSPNFYGTLKKVYEVNITIYADASKQTMLGHHQQLVSSKFNTFEMSYAKLLLQNTL